MQTQDPLTNLPDRETLREALDRTIALGENVSLATLDIDSFMEVNLDFGPETGDNVLKTLAEMLEAEATTNGGAAFRLSGDEFAILLPGLTLEQAFLKMEQLRGRIQEAATVFSVPDGRAVTVSVGVAQYPRDGKDVQSLFKATDAAVLSAKEQGRNAVGLPPNEEMVLKSCYYPSGDVRKLKVLSEKVNRKESVLLREALTDLLRKYDTVK
jgi:diguanylate cyclase